VRAWKVQKKAIGRREERGEEGQQRGKRGMDDVQTLIATLPIYLGSQYKPAYPTTTETFSTVENDALLRAVGAAKDELRRYFFHLESEREN